MVKGSINQRPIKQLAYIVDDVISAATKHNRLFGSGPFFLISGLQFDGHLYRGKRWSTDIDAVFGQWGDIQLELIQVNDSKPSVFREGAGATTVGPRFHHVCIHPTNIEQAVEEFQTAGCLPAFDFILDGGTRAVILDTVAEVGHYTEMYEYTKEIQHLYESVRNATANFGTDMLIRPIADIY